MRYLACSLLLLVLAAIWLPASALAASGPSANGGGSVFIPDRTIFGFTAVTHKDGSVSGNFLVRITTTGEFVKSEVQCLDIEDGDTATISGVITSGVLGGVDQTGACLVATGRDNGEGANSPPDLVSQVAVASCDLLPPESACFDFPQPVFLEVSGNFQVKP